MIYQVDCDLGSIYVYNNDNCMFNLLFSYKVSSVIEGTKSKRNVVTLSDGQASIDVKLWGRLAKPVIHEGTSIEVSCVNVDLYQNKRSLYSIVGTKIQVKSEL